MEPLSTFWTPDNPPDFLLSDDGPWSAGPLGLDPRPCHPMQRKTRTLILICDNPLFREGLVRVLSVLDGFRLDGVAETVGQAVEMMTEEAPDVVLLASESPSEDRGEGSSKIRKVYGGQIVRVSVSDSDMTISFRKRISQASVEDLVAALEAAE